MLTSIKNGRSLRNRKVTIVAYLSWEKVCQYLSIRLASTLSSRLRNFLSYSLWLAIQSQIASLLDTIATWSFHTSGDIEVKMVIGLCGDECESVVHVLWECPVYDSIRYTFMGELDKLLGGGGALRSLVHLII